MLDPDDQPIAKGKLCAQEYGFNLHGATRVAANDKQGRLTLCKYILRPPLANDRLKILDDETVRIDFRKPWSDGSDVVPEPTEPAPAPTEQDKPKNTSRYISWSELLRRTFRI